MTRGAISKLIDRLMVKGLVTRVEGEGDRRFQSISPTEGGRTLVPTLAGLADRNDEEPKMPLPTPGEVARTAKVKGEIETIEQQLKAPSSPELVAEEAAWERRRCSR